MKRNFTKILAALALLVFVAPPMMGWAADETITFSEMGLENGVQYTTLQGTDCTLAFGDGSNDGKYYNTGAAIRVYAGGHMTVSAKNSKTIEKIELTFGSGDGSNAITTNVNTYSDGTWQGDAQSSVTFSVGGTSGHRRIASVAITYTTGGSTPTPDIITKTLVVGTNGNCTWTNGEKTLKATVDDVTFDALGSGGNDGKYYSSDNTWRFYTQNTSGLKVSVPEGYKISTVIIKWKTGQPITPSGFTASGSTSPTTYTANSNTLVNEVSFYRNTANVLFQELTVSYEPDSDPAVSTSVTINVPEGFNTDVYTSNIAGTLTATVKDDENTPIEGAVVTWSSGNENIATINENGAVTLVAAGVTTITAEYDGLEGEYRPSSNTYELVVTNSDPNAPGTANNPFTVAEARTFIDGLNGGTSEEVYVSGIISYVQSYSPSYQSITYWISDDGERTNELEVFGGLGLEGAGFESIDDLQVGDQVVVKGHLKKYNSTYEFDSNNELVSIIHNTTPSIIVEEESVTLAYNATSGSIAYSIQNVENAIVSASSNASWLTIGDIDDTTVPFTCSINEGTEDRTATVTLSYEGAESVTVTVTQGHYVAPAAPGNWVLTDLADLTASDVFVIVGTDGDTDKSYAMTNDRGASNAPLAIEVNVVEGTLSGEIADNIQWNISGDAEGYTFYPNGTTETWLYCTNSNNGVRVGVNENNEFTMQNGYLHNTATSRYVGVLTQSTGNDWRCYSVEDPSQHQNIGNQTFAFYKKVEEESYTLTITGYTDVTEGTNNKGYYLIASPVTVDPATVEGMTTGDFDLYYFDDSQDDEWINYKADDNGAINNFNLVPGKGYLYAKKATAETPSYSFNLTGAPYTGTGEIPVAAGWNLIGNPFGVEAEISSDYYALTYESNELIATTAATHVAAMQGVFVNADEDDTVIFEAVENNTPGKGQNIALNLSKATRGASTGSATATIDRAIVRFDEGQQLPKFQLFENSTKLYIPQGNKDFAIVRSAAEGEMPVSFRASENGTYTLSIEAENVEMNYLHLIDNMTGADVDLLATPNYTFEARTNDYTSRFRLVFSAEENGASDSATFAYFNGTSWTVSNTGDATLQVVDITGRIVSSETINGNATVSLNQPAGIYMLRLVNGNDVKVQKVVVR